MPGLELQQLQALFLLRDRLQHGSSFEDLSTAAFDAMQAILGVDRASIQIFDATLSTKFVARRGLSDAYVSLVQDRWRSTFDPAHPTTFVSSDIEQDAEREPMWKEILEEGIRSLVSIPLLAQTRLLGKFVIYDASPRQFTRQEIELGETIAHNVAFAIDRMQAELALRESMSQLHLALEASNTGTWSHDLRTNLTKSDVRAQQMCGWPKEGLEGPFEEFMKRVHPEDRAAFDQSHNQRGEFTRRFRILRDDGSIRHIHSRGRFIFDAEGKHIGFAGICQDVTEEHLRELQKQQLMERLQQTQKLESLGVLAGGIAHDFNNLLVGIIGSVDLARHMGPNSRLEEALDNIETAAHRAASLAQQMLAYSGRGRVVVQAVDISELVQEMAQLLGTVVSRKAEMSLRLDRELPPVEADPTQLRQVVMNLITNASDALDGGPGQIRLETTIRSVSAGELAEAVVGSDLAAGRYIVIEVGDSGCGMDAVTVAKIFEPFFTTKFTGRGLGLAAVLGIVRSHRGAILVDTAIGRGTTFRILLPPSARTVETEQTRGKVATRRTREATILVVDDDSMVRSVTARILAGGGYRVVSAVDGLDALAKLQEHANRIDLVILDLTMPGMNGDEVLREMRARIPELPAILFSGFTDLESQQLPVRSQFLHKPYAAADLMAMVQSALSSA